MKRAMRVWLSGVAGMALLAGCATTGNRPEERAGAPVVQQLAKATRSWNGAVLPVYPQGQPEITILRITIPPGATLEPHQHTVINAGVLLSGELDVVTAEGRTLHLKAGDSNVEVVGTVHYGHNPGKVPAEIVVVYAGVEGKPVTVSP